MEIQRTMPALCSQQERHTVPRCLFSQGEEENEESKPESISLTPDGRSAQLKEQLSEVWRFLSICFLLCRPTSLPYKLSFILKLPTRLNTFCLSAHSHSLCDNSFDLHSPLNNGVGRMLLVLFLDSEEHPVQVVLVFLSKMLQLACHSRSTRKHKDQQNTH